MVAALIALVLAAGQVSPEQQTQIDALFDTSQIQACATAEREVARNCMDKILRPDTRRRLLATPFQDIHHLGVTERAPVVFRLNQAWPADLKSQMGAKVVAAGYALNENDPLFIVLQDYWLIQNGCDLDEQARVADEAKAQAYLADAVRTALQSRRLVGERPLPRRSQGAGD